jgi:DNA/RNA endonuclease YhcR with UshA esterase domain
MRYLNIAALLVLSAVVGCSTMAGPSTQPAAPMVIHATDKAAINAAMMGVTVEGVVDNVSVTDSVITINFQGTTDSQFYAVVLASGRQAVLAAFGNDLSAAITGKTVRVTGSVVPYRGRPEIVINNPEQLTVVPAAQ